MPGRDAQDQLPLHVLPRSTLDSELLEFLVDRQARNYTSKTIQWYEQALGILGAYLKEQGIQSLVDVTPAILRRYLLYLRERGHNDGGVHGHYRATRALLRWYADELAPDDWRNPISKVAAPKVPQEP
jgi:site-specific recombinase XerD